METEQTLKLERTKQRVQATDGDMSGPTFTDVNLSAATFEDVILAGTSITDANLSGVRIQQANLTGASVVDSLTDGMTIEGIAVADLIAAYRAAKPKST